MSSQSLNATTYSGYAITPSSTSGTLYMLPTPARDASDITRALRERIIYTEFKQNSVVAPGNNENAWIPYGNQIRISYLYGKLKCGSCSGNAIYGNGPYVNNVGANNGSSTNGPS